MFGIAAGGRNVARRSAGTGGFSDALAGFLAFVGWRGGGVRCQIESLRKFAHCLPAKGDGPAALEGLIGIGDESAPDAFRQACSIPQASGGAEAKPT